MESLTPADSVWTVDRYIDTVRKRDRHQWAKEAERRRLANKRLAKCQKRLAAARGLGHGQGEAR